MMEQKFNMVAKTLKGLEAVLADELRALGAEDVAPGRRMVSFRGDLETLYKANLCCRTALRILKPFYSFKADDADTLYDRVKEFDWGSLMTLDKTFAIDTVVNSDTFKHSRYVTYRVKDAIVDWFRDRYGDKRPGVRLTDADVIINVHINGGDVTLSLDSSGESLHKRGYRTAQTEAPISEVLAAGIILMSGYRGQCPFVDPMCGSGTFLIEAALIAANIMPGVYRKNFAFEHWPDFDAELFERLWNDDSAERPVPDSRRHRPPQHPQRRRRPLYQPGSQAHIPVDRGARACRHPCHQSPLRRAHLRSRHGRSLSDYRLAAEARLPRLARLDHRLSRGILRADRPGAVR